MGTRIPALKVSVYICEGESHRGVPLSSAILNFLFYRGIGNAIATRAAAGFGLDHMLRSSDFVEISDRMPVLIQFLDTAEKVNAVMGKLEEMVGKGTIEIQETTIQAPRTVATPVSRPAKAMEGPACVLTIYISEHDKWSGLPLHQALIDAFRSNDVSGVTVTRGILGYSGKKEIHRERAFHLSSDLPLIITVIEKQEKVEELMPLLEQMIQKGLVLRSEANVISYSHRSVPVAR